MSARTFARKYGVKIQFNWLGLLFGLALIALVMLGTKYITFLSLLLTTLAAAVLTAIVVLGKKYPTVMLVVALILGGAVNAAITRLGDSLMDVLVTLAVNVVIAACLAGIALVDVRNIAAFSSRSKPSQASPDREPAPVASQPSRSYPEPEWVRVPRPVASPPAPPAPPVHAPSIPEEQYVWPVPAVVPNPESGPTSAPRHGRAAR